MCLRAACGLLLLITVAAPAFAERLPTTIAPEHYDLHFTVDLENARFEGVETIRIHVGEASRSVVLNALDLTFHEVTIAAGTATQTATVSQDEAAQTATLTVPQAIAEGAAEIRIRYTGVLNNKLRGFYLSTDKERRYAVTQFESTDARRAFPCFDEPAFKATFALTVTATRGDMVVSNGKVVSDKPGPARVQHTVTFAPTPKMSTYLVAIAVGNFGCLQGGADGVPIRICATPENRKLGEIALQSAEQILKFYDAYFAIKYPFGKLDVVAVPDFAAGAMENTAAIFYRETDLLADSKSASVAMRKNIASVLAHEMAHQWFGDLVTMRWWDDIWLNEGFATWMANRPLAAAHPEWNMAVDEEEETQTALNVDSLKSTRPIHNRVESPGEIEESFDAIAYEKGAAVLRMIESYVGADTFRQGINAYLQAHAYGNATSQDFWTAITAASGKPVDRILPTFVNQPGAPLIAVTLGCTDDRTSVSLAQERFLSDAAAGTGPAPGAAWQVPVCLKRDGGSGVTCDVLSEPRQSASIGEGGCAPWVFANAGAQGYYRTAYAPELLRAMAPHVEATLTAPERLSLVSDEWALVRAGRHSVAEYLTLISGFGRERTAGVLASVTGPLGTIHDDIATGDTAARVEGFTRSLLRPTFDDIGFAPKPGDSDAHRELRATVIRALGTTGDDADVRRQARAALDQALRGGTPLDPTAAGAVVQVAAEHGDAALFDALMTAAERSDSPEDHYRYLYAITAFRDPALVEKGLQFALSPQLRSQDASLYLGRFFANPAARQRAWTFTKEHWADLEPKIAISLGDVGLVMSLASFCDAGARDDIKSFFANHKLPAASRTVDQTIERIDMCVKMRDTQAPVLARFFN